MDAYADRADREPQSLSLREEELKIEKRTVPCGEVTVHKEVIREQRTFTVPVLREELVVEIVPRGEQENADLPSTIRIPIREEQVEIRKTPVTVAEVEISKQIVSHTESFAESVAKEELRIETSGAPDVVLRDRSLDGEIP